MTKSCAVCRAKSKIRCDRCRNEFCHDHAIKCQSCGTITCIRDLNHKGECQTCGKSLGICPECLVNGKIVRTLDGPVCPECGWTA